MTAGVETVMVGYSSTLVKTLGAEVPAGSILIIDEPEVIENRDVLARVKNSSAIADVVALPIHREHDASEYAALPRPQNVTSVVAPTDYGVVWGARLADEWGLPGQGLGAARALRSKAILRARMDGVVVQPKWAVADSLGTVQSFAVDHPAGIVLKPSNLQGSVGVHVLGPGSDLADAWDATTRAAEPKYRASSATPPQYLVEEFVTGAEVSVETLVRGKQIIFTNVTAKRVLAGLRPVEVGHVVPAPSIPVAVQESLEESVRLLVLALKFDTGVLHSEWILHDGVPVLVESAGRLPGDGIDSLISLAYGFDFVKAWLLLLRGEAPVLPQKATRVAVTLLDSVSLSAEAAAAAEAQLARISGITTAHISPQETDDIVDSSGRNVHLIAVGRDVTEVDETLRAALDYVRRCKR